ncbi:MULTISPECIES: TetR/AcrR family transcriptional regulator [Burkholderia]|jgi:AcrR family transcriptional regulator|uniref:Bacterial regulatory s, tetR family protein n=1 Tax=Burkholderia gladioli TaxID=28095 RepID=A0A095HJI7_BURGA|nr:MULTISPECIES: TetR/AcrR family transcriptional regulator [Burkholderia]AJW94031.1 bacterial regulatory s, tetR family protein [Burkholderia gladioli]ASD83486.1 TetR family transcriptional regulator [Burkholderia gladioli pv. gladioli]ATF89199.1 TetR/AcrR family transcriptional regulator [Burkholderia gladioli pv. gladioli]AWY50915.1 TetR family transcriptional regulator [Burkholderia gladioli pv. gladioli]AYQ90208.1 TetR/AcrR family transcriptional regulator [Burkholderia gladioli]
MNESKRRNSAVPQEPEPAAGNARLRLLEAAEELVYAGGIHATGVDAIVKRSGAARKSFYTHFESKEALVTAALARRDDRWMAWFIDGTRERGKTPRARLLAMFDVLREWFERPDFHGCAFLNAAGEIGDVHDPIRGVARYHKERLLAFVREECDALADADGIDRRNAARLSRQWLVLIDGAIGVALVSGDASASRDARSAGEVLLAAFEARAD